MVIQLVDVYVCVISVYIYRVHVHSKHVVTITKTFFLFFFMFDFFCFEMFWLVELSRVTVVVRLVLTPLTSTGQLR